ncbi:hypothetical protein G7046_g95 [Stylonectria norvegica]|nr:hypothetical protein G7046_g95 [Stylonectria norvegica]
MSVPDKFQGFQSPSADRWLEFEKGSWQPRPFGEYDVDIKIECCGVCASDMHTISGDWGGCPYPLAVGHEVVGKVLRVGDKVTLAKVGQRVGAGAQVYSCLNCRQCKNDNETYCKDQIDAYGAPYLDTGFTTQGGYSSHTRMNEYWVYPIPEALPSTEAAPMLCAGITVYSPLKRLGAGPGKKVGIVGIGGLGHYGVMFAKALGAEVWAISRTRAKEADAKKMGADGFLATSEKGWNEAHKMSFDIIINTATSFDGFALSEYLSLLDVHGHWNSVGLPGGDGIQVRNQDFISNGCFIGSSHLGSRREMLEMLQLAADRGIKSWIDEIPLSTEGLQKAMDNLKKSSVRSQSPTSTNAEARNFRLKLALRFRRTCSKSEIISVGISPATPTVFAMYTAEQTAQTWIDVFDLNTQRGQSKTTGSQAAFSPQGSRLATVRDWTVQLAGGVEYHHSSTVMIRDFATGKTVGELKEARGDPVAWSHDGRFLAAGEGRGRMGVWDVKTTTKVGRVVSHTDTITHAAFTCHMLLVTLSRDGTLRITNPLTAKTISRLEMESSTNPRALAVSPDGMCIISIWGSTVHIWLPQTNDITSYNLNAVRRTEGWPLCISPDCRYMACWTEEGFDIMDVTSGAVIFEQSSSELVTAGAFAADGKTLVLGRMDGVVEVWDVEEKRG